MPAILGPGSVSLETCAQTRKLESTESLSRGGVSFCKRTRPAFSETGFLFKAVDPKLKE